MLMQPSFDINLLQNSRTLADRIEQHLSAAPGADRLIEVNPGGFKGSAVLFLLTEYQAVPSAGPELCLLLNKRSRKVLQPGDLCCPGGGLESSDRMIARVLRWPFTPLSRWRHWQRIRTEDPAGGKRLALLLAAALREAWEEMRLNPLRVRFLGPLTPQRLIMFDRVIYPLAGWVPKSQRLVPNWEVDRIVHIPLRRLLDPGNYGRYRLVMGHRERAVRHKDDFPCFIHRGKMGRELLWGATFRITMDFLKRVFDFDLPNVDGSPVFEGRLGQAYLSGSLMDRSTPPRERDLREEDY